MPALFPRRANSLFRGALLVAAAATVAVPLFLMGYVRTPLATGELSAPEQPVPFDHRIHVQGLRIDCRYCHSTVERAATAGIPATNVCVPCHSPVWLESSAFAPVRASIQTGESIEWQRVNRLPDYVFFNHAIHVEKGVGCETCHGRVDEMARVKQTVSLTMSWCLECHRAPEEHLRPVEEMTAMGWTPAISQTELGRELARRYHVRSLTTCTTCHR